MQYTIKKSEVLRLAAARAVQCATYETEYFKQHGETPGTVPATAKDFARVQWVNGKTEDLAFPVGKLARWVKLLPNERTLQGGKWRDTGEREILISFDGGKVRFMAGGSEVSFVAFAEQVPSSQLPGGKGYHRHDNCPRDFIGTPLRIVAPEQGGEFTLETQGEQPDLGTLKKQVADNRKAVRQQTAIATARRAQRQCLEALEAGAKSQVVALGEFEAVTFEAALREAKAFRQLRNFARVTLRNFSTAPTWLNEEQARYYGERLAIYQKAVDHSANYKPRHPWRAGKEVEKRAALVIQAKYHLERNLTTDLETLFSVEHGLAIMAGFPATLRTPKDAAQGWQHCIANSWHAARRAVRQWPAHKAELAARYLAAIQNTKHAQNHTV